jgi:leucine-rich repeat protein SHOC2
MEAAELSAIIEDARCDLSTKLDLSDCQLTSLPDSIGSLTNLSDLLLTSNQLTKLPESVSNLANLHVLCLSWNKLTSLPDSISNRTTLVQIFLIFNQLTTLPNNIGNLINLIDLRLSKNQLTSLPNSIGSLMNLVDLDLDRNQLTSLPNSIGNLSSLSNLCLQYNQLTSIPESIGDLSDLSILQSLPNLESVVLSDWKPEWLLDEENAEVRWVLINWLGYEKICEEVGAIILDTWREYTLISIDRVDIIYNIDRDPIDTEPMVLLKMICPSTAHIHILRVPPEMVSAEVAITWVNHGIHPNEFTVQT